MFVYYKGRVHTALAMSCYSTHNLSLNEFTTYEVESHI